MLKALSLVVVGASLLGCSSLSSLKQEARKELELNQSWVRAVPVSENNRFRKINRSRPVLVGDYVIQGNSHDGISAFNIESGSRVWSLKVPVGVEVSPAVINNRLFYPGLDGKIYSVDAKKGEVLWSFETKFENLGEPLLVDGTLFFLSAANVLFAVDAAEGRQVWVYSRQDSSNFSIRGGSRPVFYKGMVFSGFSDGSVVALEAKTGTIKWENQLNKNKKFRDIDANLVIDQDQLLIAGYDDHLYSLDPSTGVLKWRALGGSFSGPTIDEEALFYPTSQGEVLSLDRKTGEVKWKVQTEHGIPTEISVSKDLLFFGESQGSVKVLSKSDGKTLASFEPGMGILSPLTIKENNIFFISGEGNLYSLELREKQKGFWRH